MRPLLLLLLSPLAAQEIVSPRHWTNAESNAFQFDAIGITTTPNRYLEIHGNMLSTPVTINKVSFRRDASLYNTAAPGFSILVDVFLSTSVTLPSAPNATFDSNHGVDKTQVLAAGQVQFPAHVPGRFPRPWDYAIPLAQPFSFAGNGPLCTELRISSRTNAGGQAMDYSNGTNANPVPPNRVFGTGCRFTANGPRLTLSATSSANWSSSAVTLGLQGANGKPNSNHLLLVGVSDSNYGGLPLPFALPGTDTAPSGTCTLYNDILLQLPITANASGGMSINLGLGVTPFMNGLSVFSQILGVDPAANGWALVFSNAAQHHIVAPYSNANNGVGEVFLNAGAGATGTVRANVGYVMKFN